MRIRHRSAAGTAHRFASGLACLCLVAANAQAEDIGPGDVSRPVDTSKHGSVEAEIPPTRQSSSPPPSQTRLVDILTEPRWDRGGYFLGMGGHYAMELTEQIGGLGELAPSGGVSIRVGMKHNRFWQTELSSMYTSKFKSDGVDFFVWGVYAGERFYLTKTRLQPYVGASVGFQQLRGTNYDGGVFAFSPRFNAGLNLYQRQTFNWELDLAYYLGVGAGDDSDFITVTLGFTWF